ncbi:non-ribosomal peptide synthetase [Paraburkholderia sp. SIMBA_027]
MNPTLKSTPGMRIIERFMTTAHRWPDNVAVIHGDSSITYGELAHRAGEIGVGAARLGAGAGDVVGVLFDKSIDAVATMLGLLIQRIAFHPLSKQSGLERNVAILRKVRPRFVVTDSGDTGYGIAGLTFIALDLLRNSDDESLRPPSSVVTNEFAYLISTSGSTGFPKTVAITNEAIGNYIEWRLRYYHFSPDSRLLQFAPLSFDSAISDLFSMFGSGGAVVLVDEKDRINANKISELIRSERVTHFSIVPSLYERIIPSISVDSSLVEVTVAGERLPASLAAAHFNRLSQVRLVNEYGPCECAIGVSAYHVTKQDAIGCDCLPVGSAIQGVELRICDEQMKPLPPNQTGEILISGLCVAGGYIADPEETLSHFVSSDGIRMYRTGDVGYADEQGCISVIGRTDRMVKIFGNRVHLSEIERVLEKQKEISEAAVIFDDGKLQAACVTTLTGEQIRARIKPALPPYMQPSIVAVLSELPMTVNGKRDYSRISEIVEELMRPDNEDIADEAQRKVYGIWRDVLKFSKIRIDDSFFDVGGSSLYVLEIHHRLQQVFGVNRPIDLLLDADTIESQARLFGSN